MSLVKQTPRPLSVTDMVSNRYCQTGRLLWLQKNTKPPFQQNFGMLRGTNEHEVRRLLADSIRTEYQSCSDVNALANVDYKSCIEGAIADGLKLGRPVSPKFYLGLVNMSPELRYRLSIQEKQRLAKATSMLKQGKKMEEIVSKLLPWQTETGVGSTELGVRGIIDQLYKIDNKLIPLDFKTHTNKFSAYIWREAYKEQLILYAILAELKYPGTKADTAVLEFTEDFDQEKFKITKKDKEDAKKRIKEARMMLKINRVPPKLTGDDEIKCSKCYLKEHCFAFEEDE